MQRSERFIERTEFGVCEMQPDGSKLGQRNDGKKILKLEEKTRLMTILLWWSEQNNYRGEGRRRTATEVAYVTAAMADRFQANKTTTLLPDSG
jgi:hypothetical protein